MSRVMLCLVWIVQTVMLTTHIRIEATAVSKSAVKVQSTQFTATAVPFAAQYTSRTKNFAKAVVISAVTTAATVASAVNANAATSIDASTAAPGAAMVPASSLLEDRAYEKPFFNVPPGRTAFPPQLRGSWRTELRFAGAEFTKQIPTQQLAQDPNIPGFRKYSVAFVPDFGTDCTAILRFAGEGSGGSSGVVYEDRAANVKALMEAFMRNERAAVDSIEYDKGNRCSLVYHGLSTYSTFNRFHYCIKVLML